MSKKSVKEKNDLYEFVKPNGTIAMVNENSAVHAAELGWMPRSDFEAKLKADAEAAKKSK